MNAGIACSVLSSFLFALLYYYSTVLRPLSGEEVFAWRVLLALPVIAVLVYRARAWSELHTIVQGAAKHWLRSV